MPSVHPEALAVADEIGQSPTLTCPACHQPAYVCHAEHTEGPGPRLHCTAASLHNFPLPEKAGRG